MIGMSEDAEDAADDEQPEEEPACEICGELLDPRDELANLQLRELHDERGWTWYFCCPNHLLTWVHSDPTELEPYLAGG